MVSHKVSITLVLFFCINLISINIYASNVGGWSLGGGVAQGASTVYEGTKKVIIDGKDYIKKGTAIVTPTAANVAKTLGKGVAGVAVSVAVEQLLGAVDWVLDPANNQIKYTVSNDDPSNPSNQYLYGPASWGAGVWYGSPSSACNGSLKALQNGTTYYNSSTVTTVGTSCHFNINGNTKDHKYGLQIKPNPVYDPQAEQEQKTIPLDAVAQQVISNAEGNTNKKAGAQVATGAAAADIVAEAEADQTGVKARPIAQQLENSASTKPADEAAAAEANTATGTQTKNPTKPETTDLALEFPAFCGWAPIVCEAAQKVISFPITLTNWWETGKLKAEEWANSISEAWTSAKEWVKEEPSKDDQVEIEEKQPEQKTVDLNFGSACPAPVVLIDSTFYDQPFKIEYSFNDFCSILSDFVRPVLIAMGAFISALILGGVKTNE